MYSMFILSECGGRKKTKLFFFVNDIFVLIVKIIYQGSGHLLGQVLRAFSFLKSHKRD